MIIWKLSAVKLLQNGGGSIRYKIKGTGGMIDGGEETNASPRFAFGYAGAGGVTMSGPRLVGKFFD